jgi:hypothetical protein
VGLIMDDLCANSSGHLVSLLSEKIRTRAFPTKFTGSNSHQFPTLLLRSGIAREVYMLIFIVALIKFGVSALASETLNFISVHVKR